MGEHTGSPLHSLLLCPSIYTTEVIVILGKESKPKKKRILLRLLNIFLVIAVVTAISSYFSYKYVLNSDKNNAKEAVVSIDPSTGIPVEIPLNSSTTSIANLLNEKGIVKYPYVFKILSKINGYDGMYKSGTHILENDPDRNKLTRIVTSYDRIMRILVNKPESVKITIPEGYTYKQIADLLYKKRLVDRDKFDKTVNSEKFNYKFLENLPKRENRLEGYLFPDTYEFDMKVGEKEIIRQMLENFNRKFKPDYYKRAKELNMTTDQIIILASIIEREAKLKDERKIISGVFYNRLNSKDKTLRKLQSCATIQYIFFNRDGIIKEKISEQDTKVQDPYNTYEIEGLPPGPICSPGVASIEAALYPEKTGYYYFVAKGDGSHQFSKSFKEHEAAVKKYGLN